MKRVISLLLSFVLFTSVTFCVYAKETPPVLNSQEQYGVTLQKVYVYSVNEKNKSLDFTKANGKTVLLKKNKRVNVIGKSADNNSLLYISFNEFGAQYFAYIDNYYVCVENQYNYTYKSVNLYNSYYKRTLKYKYFTYDKMPFYQFNQTGKSGIINGLKIAYSCGPQAIAAACSALYGNVITPEKLMKNMKPYGIYASGNGSLLSYVERGLHPYIEKTYNLKYESKLINPKDAFDYLKNGYMVILGVENRDGNKTFTALSHYILLVGFDSAGNVITVNSNLKTKLFDSFSVSRIKKNMPNSNFYKENTIAIKYKYDDEYTPFSDEVICKAQKNITASQHYCKMGRIYKLKKGASFSVIGVKDDRYFISFKNNENEEFAFIDRREIENYLSVKGDAAVYTYDSSEHMPTLTLYDYQGKPVPEEKYELSYPEKSINAGTYKINITYSDGYIGESFYEYSILPPPPSITSLDVKKNGVKLKWEPLGDENQITDYVIEYSTDKSFENNVLSETVPSRQKSYTVKDLQSGKTYYFRIASEKAEGENFTTSSFSNTQSALI